jgi:hypothetical protein
MNACQVHDALIDRYRCDKKLIRINVSCLITAIFKQLNLLNKQQLETK